MDKKQCSVFMRVLLFLGIIFFIINSVLFYLGSSDKVIRACLFSGLIIQLLIGTLIICLKTPFSKKGYQYFIALTLITWGILNFLFTFLVKVDVNVWWPLYLVVSSIILLFTGRLIYKKFKFGYVIPGFTLFIMGIWFSLFSFDIVKIPFRVIVLVLGPAFILIVGLCFVLFFLAQQRHKNLVLHDENLGDFDDEELTFPKLD